MSRSYAEIEYSSEYNSEGRIQDCVYAHCVQVDYTVGPVWGHSDKAVKRVLATLSENCLCGSDFHYNSDN